MVWGINSSFILETLLQYHQAHNAQEQWMQSIVEHHIYFTGDWWNVV